MGHVERKKDEEFVKNMYANETEDFRRRGRSVVRWIVIVNVPGIVRWKDSVKEYMHKRGADREGGIEQARRKCVDR